MSASRDINPSPGDSDTRAEPARASTRLRELATRCADTASTLRRDHLDPHLPKLNGSCDRVARAWCGSWWGYHASVYLEGFRPHSSADSFNTSWGIAMSRGGPWVELDLEEVRTEILRRAGDIALSGVRDASHAAEEAFDDVRREATPLIDPRSDASLRDTLKQCRLDLAKLRNHVDERIWLASQLPQLNPMAGDERALSAGVKPPHHLRVQAEFVRWASSADALDQLGDICLQAAQYAEQREGGSMERTPSSGVPARTRIFLVHGHDTALKDRVARHVHLLTGQPPIILEEQPGGSRTIIELIELHAAEAAFAIVLLTGDDEGRKRGFTARTSGAIEKRLKPKLPVLLRRARQNVVLELGYFMARLGRDHVCALYEDGVELPSDFAGVKYLRVDPEDAWSGKLGNELGRVGLRRVDS